MHEFPLTVTITVAVGGIAREHTVVVPAHVHGAGYGYNLPAEDEAHGVAFTEARYFIGSTVMDALAVKSREIG